MTPKTVSVAKLPEIERAASAAGLSVSEYLAQVPMPVERETITIRLSVVALAEARQRAQVLGMKPSTFLARLVETELGAKPQEADCIGQV